MRYLESITQLTLGVWIGAMAGFAASAPAIFRAFGTERQRAGNLAGEIIGTTNNIGMVLAAIALLCLLPRLKHGLNRWRLALVAAALCFSLVGAFYIFPQMNAAQPPVPIEQLAPTDPARVNYNNWHNRSRQVFGAAILLGAAAVVLGPLGKGER